MNEPRAFVNVFDVEAAALEMLPEPAVAYLTGGAGDEITLRRNREAFDALRLEPRMLADVSTIDTALDLFEERMPTPLLVAPTGYHRMFHADGERATARGAAAAGATFVVSTMATTTIEAIAEVSDARLWFQLYVQNDEAQTMKLVRRAEDAGCSVLVITVDTPVLGSRDRERRMVFPAGEMHAVHLGQSDADGTYAHQWAPGSIYSPLLSPTLDWDQVARIRTETRLPVVLKGILSPEDARIAAGAGVAGIIVSNHGGRNLDTAPAAIEALPHVVRAVQGRIPVLMDGGVRRGTDVLKALALGAKAVLLGRPVLWGLTAAGAEGVTAVLALLEQELRAAMALCGKPRLESIGPDLIWQRQVP